MLTWQIRRHTSFGEVTALTTWNNNVNLRNTATEKEYNDSDRHTPSRNGKFSLTVVYIENRFLWCDATVPPLLRPDGSLTHCPKKRQPYLQMCLIVNRVR